MLIYGTLMRKELDVLCTVLQLCKRCFRITTEVMRLLPCQHCGSCWCCCWCQHCSCHGCSHWWRCRDFKFV